MQEDELNPGDRELEEALAGLRPAGASISRDELMFQAGRRSMSHRLAVWRICSTAAAVLAVVAFLRPISSGPQAGPLAISSPRPGTPGRGQGEGRLAKGEDGPLLTELPSPRPSPGVPGEGGRGVPGEAVGRALLPDARSILPDALRDSFLLAMQWPRPANSEYQRLQDAVLERGMDALPDPPPTYARGDDSIYREMGIQSDIPAAPQPSKWRAILDFAGGL